MNKLRTNAPFGKSMPSLKEMQKQSNDNHQSLASKQAYINALESHNRELLAVIAAKDEALRMAISHIQHIGTDASIEQALALKPGDIALVEVGSVDCQFVDGIGEHHVAEFCHLPEGVTKLYVLQKKEGANVST